MLYQGHAIKVQELEHHFVEVCFDLEGESVNKLNQFTLEELRQAIAVIADNTQINGVIFSSAKDVFIVGADITEFTQMFSHSEERIAEHLLSLHDIFNAIEDLHCPTVTAINGIALGGGFELCLSTDFRVMAESAKVGLPEVKLGIYPGWGGTIRLPRLIGVDNANEWICAGSEKRAGQALKEGAVDAVVSLSDLHQAAVDLLLKVAAGDFDYQRRRTEKQKPIPLSQMEQLMAFESAKGVVGAKAGPHYPAPLAALASMQKSVNLPRDKAAQIEVKGFATLAKNAVTKSLVGLFLNDQAVKKMAKRYEALSNSVTQAAVLGAGIMGGGVAYQSASKNIPIFMKDINTSAIQLGLQETSKLLTAQVERGRLKPAQIADVLNRITPALNYGGFSQVDIVVEAVKEDLSIKKSVLAEVEQQLAETAILTSNTSTISINTLASELQRPENFCGMHFFNPVHKMPLVEVIRGNKSSEQAIATTVAYAKSLGKTPIVVNDCPGFFVNRVLFPYFSGFALLMRDGVDFVQVDKIMEQFGWPMGPAYLLDVVGIDTAHHANQVMAAGFPERMQMIDKSVIEYMYEQQRYGQKNKKGFYVYGEDKRGKPLKQLDESNMDYLRQLMGPKVDYTEEDIINRMMIPMCIEVARCLEEGIIDSPAEADMALIYGIGFPPFRGGICHYLDTLGLAQFVNIAASYAHLGPLYQPTDRMQHMAAQNETYFSH